MNNNIITRVRALETCTFRRMSSDVSSGVLHSNGEQRIKIKRNNHNDRDILPYGYYPWFIQQFPRRQECNNTDKNHTLTNRPTLI